MASWLMEKVRIMIYIKLFICLEIYFCLFSVINETKTNPFQSLALEWLKKKQILSDKIKFLPTSLFGS